MQTSQCTIFSAKIGSETTEDDSIFFLDPTQAPNLRSSAWALQGTSRSLRQNLVFSQASCRPAAMRRARRIPAVPSPLPNSGANARRGLVGRLQQRSRVGNASARAGLRRNACPALGAGRRLRCSTRSRRCAGRCSRASWGRRNRRPLATFTSVGLRAVCLASRW